VNGRSLTAFKARLESHDWFHAVYERARELVMERFTENMNESAVDQILGVLSEDIVNHMM
jgi:hypothetical protein